MKRKKEVIILMISLSCLGVGMIFSYFWLRPSIVTPVDWQTEKSGFKNYTHESQKEKESSDSHVAKSKSESILVDIKGAVTKPGVYELSKDARMHQLIQLAGGLTEQADAKVVNLASILSDQQLVYVPIQGESIDMNNNQERGSTEIKTSSQKINLNQATISDLQKIKGVGEKKAQAIIDYRNKIGKFSSVDQLAEVDGFGKKTVEKIRDSITI